VSGFHGSAYLSSLPWTVGAVVVLLAVTFAFGVKVGRHNVIDTAWGLGFCVVTATTFVCSIGHGYDPRRTLLLFMVLIWGLRLSWHILRRSLGKGEDPRYKQMLSKGKGNPNIYALRMVYATQGLLVLFVSLPVAFGMFEGADVGLLGALGVVIWAVGLYFESTGDRQMSKFKADPANKGKLIDVGLWRYTRHPNYFGDACVWAGLFLLVAESWPGVLTILSPIVMIYLLANGSGKKVLERSMMKRPGYPEYMQRTSGFFPLPPREPASK
jgi:steroid 5-alpha reductase family enzyme